MMSRACWWAGVAFVIAAVGLVDYRLAVLAVGVVLIAEAVLLHGE